MPKHLIDIDYILASKRFPIDWGWSSEHRPVHLSQIYGFIGLERHGSKLFCPRNLLRKSISFPVPSGDFFGIYKHFFKFVSCFVSVKAEEAHNNSKLKRGLRPNDLDFHRNCFASFSNHTHLQHYRFRHFPVKNFLNNLEYLFLISIPNYRFLIRVFST